MKNKFVKQLWRAIYRGPLGMLLLFALCFYLIMLALAVGV